MSQKSQRTQEGREVWTQRMIDEVRLQVRSELPDSTQGKMYAKRLRVILAKLGETQSDFTSHGQLRSYVLIMSALIQHQRSGGLTSSQVNSLFENAIAVLKGQGVEMSSKRLAGLYGDLHLAISQIWRRSGRPWEAAWEHQMAGRLSRNTPQRGEEFQAVGFAIRTLRLGNAAMAIEQFRLAQADTVSESNRILAALGQVKALRMQGRWQQARELADEVEQTMNISTRHEQELSWERLCVSAQENRDFFPLIHSVRKNGPHYQGVYILEAFLWARSTHEVKWTQRLMALATYKRKRELGMAQLAALTRSVSIIEDCYSTQFPFYSRLQKMGQCLAEVRELVSIEHELLVLAAAARWLTRSKVYNMANMVIAEYEALSYRLTGLQNPDVLGVLGNLSEKNGTAAYMLWTKRVNFYSGLGED